ncbi:MAG: thiolase family protein [bacterium]
MRKVAIIGTGQIPHRSRMFEVNEQELIAPSVRAAIEDAGIEPSDIEATVFGSAITSIQDGIEGVGRLVVDSMGGVLKPSFRVHTGGTVGASAALAAVYLVASGDFDVALAAAGTVRAGASGPRSQRALQLVGDPIYARGFSGGAVMGLAMNFKKYMEKTGTTEKHAAMCVVDARKNAGRNPFAHLKDEVTVAEVLSSPPLAPPVKRMDMCPTSIGSAAIVVASEKFAKGKNTAWVKGISAVGEPNTYPDRDVIEAKCVREAAGRAYSMAGMEDPAKQVQLVELYNACSYQTMQWAECLFLCGDGEAKDMVEKGAFSFDGKIPINPSGGVLTTNNGSDAAMLRVVEAAVQVMGKGGERQVGDVKNAIAMGWGGGQQFACVFVLSGDANY